MKRIDGHDGLEVTDHLVVYDGGLLVAFPAVGDAVVETLRPIREEAQRILSDKAYLEKVYTEGAQKASYVANKTLRKVYKKIGFVAR